MKKKLAVVGILAVFMLVTISYASAVNSEKDFEKKESPIFKVRTKQANYEDASENVDVQFIGSNQFLLPIPDLETSNDLSKSLTIRLFGCTWMSPGCATWRYTCPILCTWFGRTCLPGICPTLTIC